MCIVTIEFYHTETYKKERASICMPEADCGAFKAALQELLGEAKVAYTDTTADLKISGGD